MALTGAAKHFKYIDCARGYAVLLVMASHTANLFPELPWRFQQVVLSGWFGVQLFFVTSMLTLLMSWRSPSRNASAHAVWAYVAHRLFRIAPAYWLAAALYAVILVPPPVYEMTTLLSVIGFYNAWMPMTLTGPGRWEVVPGGWSVSVEMSFYILFPFYANLVRSEWQAWATVFLTIVFGLASNVIMRHLLQGQMPSSSVSNYLYYWLPNQLSVFAIGGVVYHVLTRSQPPTLAKLPSLSAIAAIAAFIYLTSLPKTQYLGDGIGIPGVQAAAAVLACFLIALSGGGFFVNSLVAWIGKISFSVYLLHFAIIVFITDLQPSGWSKLTGVGALLAYSAVLFVVGLLTCAVAFLSWSYVERPGITMGRRVGMYLQSFGSQSESRMDTR